MIYSFGIVGPRDHRIPLATVESVVIEQDVVHGYVSRDFAPAYIETAEPPRFAVWPTGQHDPVLPVHPRPVPEVGSFFAVTRIPERQP